MRRSALALPVLLVAFAGCGDDDADAPRAGAPIVCPAAPSVLLGDGATTPAPPANGGWDARELQGMTVEQATARAAEAGCTVRVVERDGTALPVTHDLRNTRVNVAERDGRVARVEGVG